MVLQADARAGLARRLAATVYESLILAALALVLGFVLLPVMGLTAMPGRGGAARPDVPAGKSNVIRRALRAVRGLLRVVVERRPPNATDASLATGTAQPPAGSPSPARALVRYLAWWIGPACAIGAYLVLRPLGHGRWALAALALNYAWALVDPDRQFLHDRIAGTRLVRV